MWYSEIDVYSSESEMIEISDLLFRRFRNVTLMETSRRSSKDPWLEGRRVSFRESLPCRSFVFPPSHPTTGGEVVRFWTTTSFRGTFPSCLILLTKNLDLGKVDRLYRLPILACGLQPVAFKGIYLPYVFRVRIWSVWTWMLKGFLSCVSSWPELSKVTLGLFSHGFESRFASLSSVGLVVRGFLGTSIIRYFTFQIMIHGASGDLRFYS